MGTLGDLICNTRAALTRRIGAVLVLRRYGTAETSDSLVTASEGVSGGTLAVDVSTLPSGLATTALQTAGTATLATLAAAEAQPTLWTAVTPSDSTDLTALATKGLFVGVAGNLVVRLIGAPTTTVTVAAQQGYYPGAFTRVMAATTATGVVALA